MAHIIDLKNKDRESKPAHGPEFGRKETPTISKTPERDDIEPQLYHQAPSRPQSPVRSPSPAQSPGDSFKFKIISWSGPLYYHQPDARVVWFAAFILFAVAALLQVFQKNLITTIFFGLLGTTVLIRSHKIPPNAKFEASPLGVKVNDRTYGYREIKSFWVEYRPEIGIKELSLQLKKWYRTYVKMPIGNQNPVQLRTFLIDFIPEAEHEDTIADVLNRKLGM